MSNVRLFNVGKLRIAVGTPDQLGLVMHGDGPRVTADVVQDLAGKVYAAVDGPMFEFASGETRRNYAEYMRATIRFAHYYPLRGIDVPGLEPSRGVSIYVANGIAGAELGRGTRRSGETFRVQTYPSLVVNRTATNGLIDNDRNTRPAIGLLSDGRVFLALGRDIQMPELAAALAALNLGTTASPVRVTWAGYLDGGGSAALYVDETLDGNPEANINLRGRRVVSWVTLEQKPTGLAATAASVAGAARTAISRIPGGELTLIVASSTVILLTIVAITIGTKNAA